MITIIHHGHVFNGTVTVDINGVFDPLGMYPVRSINARLVKIIDACYSHSGIINDTSAVYSPYSSKSEELCSSNSPVSKSVCVPDRERLKQEGDESQ